jgi:rod shape-determining protein MreD
MRRAIGSPILLTAALVLQLTVVNRLRLPGSGPDLVLLTVVALALYSGPAAGAVTGFGAGLALDLAPPGSYLIGEYALVFCVIGYLCGRLRGSLNHSALLMIALAMAAAAAGEALYALLGVVVSDPQVTWSAVRQVLPSSVVYDVAVTPFLLYGVMRAVRWADGLGRRAPAERQADGAALLAREAGLPAGALHGRTMLGGAGLLGGAGWLAGPVRSGGPRGARKGASVHIPRTPRLRAAAARPGDGWLGGGPRSAVTGQSRRGPARPGRAPRLRPGAGSPGSAAARPPRPLPRSPANLRIAARRRRDGNIGRRLGTGQAGSAHRGSRSGPPGSAFRSRRPPARLPLHGAAAGLPRTGVPGHGPKFRPDRRQVGGSSSAEMLRARALRRGVLHGGRPGGGGLRARALRGRTLSRGGLSRGGLSRRGLSRGGLQRIRPGRGGTVRLGTGRRHDGVIGGGVLGGGRSVGLSGLRGGSRRGLAVRPASLRLGSARRGDGILGGGVLTKQGLARRSRRATPRFRSRPTRGARSLFGGRVRLGAGKQARFSSRRTPLLASLTHGRLGGRSAVWRIGSRRTGGLR